MGDLSRIAAEILLSLQPILAGANIDPPRMVAVEPQKLQMWVCGKPCKVMAWYAPEGTIYIDNRLNVAKHVGARSVVVHELVHHVQRRTHGGRAQSCEEWMQREQEAYATQAIWLRSKGVRARNITFQARFLRCGRPAVDEDPQAPDSGTDNTILSTHSDEDR